MKSRLIGGLSEADAEEVTRQYNNYAVLRNRMREILEKDLDALHVSMRDEEKMETASWPFLHASKLGEARALSKLISLLS